VAGEEHVMPGMSTYLQTKNPVVVAAFHTALLHQLLLIGFILVLLSIAWNALRTVQYRRLTGDQAGRAAPIGVPLPPEPVARRALRIGFGLFWILDGLLQLQSAMPLGLPTSALEPSANSSPAWVQDVVHFGVTLWTRHPVQAATSAVWLQLGIGAVLLVAPRGRWSRFAGLAATGWGLIVWVFGEAFGGIFGHGSSWLFGAPGAVLLYCLAGALVALPESAWGPRLGKRILQATGVFFVAMAILQSWPGRGFWQGSRGGTLATMIRQMAQTSQPHELSSIIRAFGRFEAANAWEVNLSVVLLLAAIGLAFCTTRPRAVRGAMFVAVALCVADWILVQDLGFLGGVGTDPNSMLPMVLIFVSAYLALTGVEAPVRVPSLVPAAATQAGVGSDTIDPGAERPWWDRVASGYLTRVLATISALVVVLVGAVPMASASVNPNADPILAVAVDGTPNTVDVPAPSFDLVNQEGRPVTLGDLRGRTVALTFLDPVCTSDCPLIAQEFRNADSLLNADSSRVVFVAVVANEIYRSTAFTKAFDRQEGLDHMRNWLFLTGSLSALKAVWEHYGIAVQIGPAGAMAAHSDLAYLIDARGHTREVLSTEPGNGSASSSSFSVYLAAALDRVVHT